MLRFLIGGAGTGKTAAILAEIRARAEAGLSSVLLVPEQFSWQAENDMFRLLGDRLSAFAEVYSFTALAREIEKKEGGAAALSLSDAGRCVFMRRALDLLGEEVREYSRHRRDGAFCAMCADAVKELKAAGLTPARLHDIAAEGGEAHRRLAELALIFGEYEAAISGRYEDEADRVKRAAEKISPAFFGDKAIYLDSFDGFTAPELDMLEKCLPAPGGCTVALTCDSLLDKTGGFGLFAHTQKTAARLLAMAQRLEVEVAPTPLYTKRHRFAAPGLDALDVFLREGARPATGEGVLVTGYPDAYWEARAVTAEIRRLGAQEGIPFEQIAVIGRDIRPYISHFRRLGALYDVPFFVDETESIEHTGPIAMIRCALSIAARGINTQDVLRMLKTELFPFSAQEIAALENYLFTWQIRYAGGWAEPFTQNPEGFSQRMGPEQELALEQAEKVRGALYAPLAEFAQAASGCTGEELAKRLYLLFDRLGAPKEAARRADELDAAGENTLCAARRRVWNVAMALLDEMAHLLGDDRVAPREFDELFLLLVRSSDVGAQPQNIGAVTLAGADRMRLAAPRAVFLLGAGEGQFPSFTESEGLLTNADRELLGRAGVEMQGAYLNRALRENLIFYKALTAPSHRLYVSFSEWEGEAQTLSAALARFASQAGAGQLESPPEVLGATPKAALSLLSESWRQDSPVRASLAAALEGAAAPQLRRMEQAAAAPKRRLADLSALRRVLGAEMDLSPSRAESYSNCHFSYYLQYVLRLRPRRRAELSPLESGSFVHYVLENAMRSAGEALPSYTDEEIRRLAQSIADRYVAENMQGDVADTRRFRALLGRLKSACGRRLCHIAAEQRQSAFRPLAYELEIGPQKEVEPLTLKTPAGDRVQVVGKIDRLDVMRAGEKSYVRVVDYKTGAKRFSLDDVYYGLNTQMLIYLFTVCRNGRDRLGQTVPAGVLYLRGDPAPRAGERGEGAGPIFRADGLILRDEAVLTGMERDKQGFFIPVQYKKDGTPRASACLAGLEEMGRIERHIETLLTQMAADLYGGDIAPEPVRGLGHDPCQYCDYRTVCRHRDGFSERELIKPDHPFEKEETP